MLQVPTFLHEQPDFFGTNSGPGKRVICSEILNFFLNFKDLAN